MSFAMLVVICLAGTLVPGIGADVALAGALALAEGPGLVALIGLAAAAQAVGKLGVYAAAAAGSRRLRPAAARCIGSRTTSRLSPRGASALVFASALLSVPPLYATSVACGAAGHGRARFGIAVFAARTLRYSAIAVLVDGVRAVLP